MSIKENINENQEKKNEDEEILILNIITLGQSGVGKTSIINRYVYNKFDPDKISTIGINFAFKEIILKNNKKIKIKLIDTAGQEKYRALTKSYFKNAEAVLFVFSHDHEDSLDKIKEFKELLNSYNTLKDIPQYLIRNKIDLLEEDNVKDDEKSKIEEKYSEESLKDFIKTNKFLKYISTSAKNENNNLDDIFKSLAETWYQKCGKEKEQKLFLSKDKKKGKNNGCCFIKSDL